MIVSIHLVDAGVSKVLRPSRWPFKLGPRASIPGLENSHGVIAAPLGPSLLTLPQPGRQGLIAFWDNEESLESFVDCCPKEHPLARDTDSGWQLRLELLRVVGSWPGVDQPDGALADSCEGPVAALTLGRLRFTQALRFLKTSKRAEGAVIRAPGLLWGTGLAGRGRLVATFSLWRSTKEMRAYAAEGLEHRNALKEDSRKGFHHESAFLRFRPFAMKGKLGNRNPLPEGLLSQVLAP